MKPNAPHRRRSFFAMLLSGVLTLGVMGGVPAAFAADPDPGITTITGRVVDADTLEPIEGLLINLEWLNGDTEIDIDGEDPAVTGTDGRFSLETASARDFRRAAVSTRGNEEKRRITTWSEVFQPKLGKNHDVGDITVAEGAVLRGALTPPPDLMQAYDHNIMFLGAGANRHENVSVEINPGMTANWITAVPAGTYKIAFNDSNEAFTANWWHNATTEQSATTLTVEVGDTVSNLDTTLEYAPYRISGTVTYTDGSPVAGVHVNANADNGYGWATTNAAGQYLLATSAPGEYIVEFEPQSGTGIPQYYDDSKDYMDATPVVLTAGSSHRNNVDAVIERGSTVSGTVTVTGAPDDEYKKVVLINVNDEDASNEYANVESDGSFTVTDIPPGTYIVEFRASVATQYYDNVTDRSNAREIVITAGAPQAITDIDAHFQLSLGTIEGTITRNGLTPDQWDDGWDSIEILHADTGAYATGMDFWGSEDTYSITVEAGDYVVRLKQAGGAVQYFDNAWTMAAAEVITVAEGSTQTADFTVGGGRISGTVTSPSDESVLGAIAELYTVDDLSWPVRSTDVASDGTFSFAELPPNNYAIKITSGDTLYSERWCGGSGTAADPTIIDLAPNGEFNNANVVLQLGGGLEGTIEFDPLDESGYAWITLYDENGNQVASRDARLDESTIVDYRLSGIPAGQYKVRVEYASGPTAWWEDVFDFDSATPVEVVAGEMTSNIDFTPNAVDPRIRSISGTVGLEETGRAATSGTVFAFPVDQEWVTASGDIRADGSYVLYDLAAGDYNLLFTAEDGAHQGAAWYPNSPTRQASNVVTLASDEAELVDFNTVISAGTPVSGRVTDAATGKGLESINLSIRDIASGASRSLFTNSSGYFHTSIAEPGPIRVSSWGSGTYFGVDDLELTVDPVDGLSNLNIQLSRGYSVSGTITSANNGVPVRSVNVSVMANGSNLASYDWSNVDGTYSAGPLPPGTYDVFFENYNGLYVAQWYDNVKTQELATPVVLGVGGVTGIDAALTLGGTVVGTIRDENGDPIAGATVGLATAPEGVAFRMFTGAAPSNPILGIETTTEADGTYELPPIAPGTYTMYFRDWDHKTTWYDGVATRDSATPITIGGGTTTTVSQNLAGLGLDEESLAPEQTLTTNFEITAQPRDAVATPGDTVSFVAFASGQPLPTVQWQTKLPGGSWEDIGWETTTALWIDVDGFAPGTLYRAVFTQNGVSLESVAATLTVTGPLPAPAMPTVSAVTTSGATIGWAAPASGDSPTGYEVKVYVAGETAPIRTIQAGNVTTQTVSGLADDTAFETTVTAINDAGIGAESPRAAFTTLAIAVPDAPAAPSVGATGQTTASATWAEPANGGSAITGYEVRVQSGGVDVAGAVVSFTGRAATITGLEADTDYTVSVRAANVKGAGGWSAGTPVRTLENAPVATVPGAPAAPTVSIVSSTEVSVAWAAPASDGGAAISGYALKVYADGSEVTDAHISVAGMTAAITRLSPETEYTVTVAARNSEGFGSYSEVSAAVITPALPRVDTPPAAPGTPTLTAVSTTSLKASWAAPAQDGGKPITGYTVQVLKDGVAMNPTVTVTGTSAIISGLAPDTGYSVTVTATNGVGTGPASAASAVVKTKAVIPDPPKALTVTPVPTVSGATTVGSTLTLTAGTWSPAPVTLKYQWKRGGVAIVGATGTSHKLVAADVGKTITVSVTGSKTGYTSVTKTSAATAKVTTPKPPSQSVKPDRIFGDDRYSTAVAVSKAGFTGTAPVVYIATGQDYPDALAAAPAAAKRGGPLLLTASKSLPAVVAAELKRLKPAEIVVVGGTGAVSTTVEKQLKKLTKKVTRLGGSDRFATSQLVIRNAFSTADTVYVATGLDFPDALSASAAGGSSGAPVVLVDGRKGKSLDAKTAGMLKSLKVKKTFIAGGTAVVNTTIEKDLKKSTTVKRFAGNDRFETSQLINKAAFPTANRTFLATGMQFPDALAGAALAGAQSAPLYVVSGKCIPAGILKDIDASGTKRVTLIGGTGALSTAVEKFTRC